MPFGIGPAIRLARSYRSAWRAARNRGRIKGRLRSRGGRSLPRMSRIFSRVRRAGAMEDIIEKIVDYQILKRTHIAVWTDLIATVPFGAGQLVLAGMILDEGSKYLENKEVGDWSPEAYILEMLGVHEAMPQAMSISIDQAAMAITHVAMRVDNAVDKAVRV